MGCSLAVAFCLSAFSSSDCLQTAAWRCSRNTIRSEPSDFFADGMSARPRIPGTVARGEVAMVGYLATGKINGQDGDGFPFPITMQVMNRGEERFNIYCSVCHGKARRRQRNDSFARLSASSVVSL